jgi:hypothetical protein
MRIFDLEISPEVFDEASRELANALDDFSVPEREKQGVRPPSLPRRARSRPVPSRGRSTGAAGAEPGVIEQRT